MNDNDLIRREDAKEAIFHEWCISDGDAGFIDYSVALELIPAVTQPMSAVEAMHGYSDYNEIYDPKALLRTYLYNAKFTSVGDFCKNSYEYRNRRMG